MIKPRIKKPKLKEDISLLGLFETLDLSINVLNYLKFKTFNRLLNVKNSEFHELITYTLFKQEKTIPDIHFSLKTDNLTNIKPPYKRFFERIKFLELVITRKTITESLLNVLSTSLERFSKMKISNFKLKFKRFQPNFANNDNVYKFQDLIYKFLYVNKIERFQSDMYFCFNLNIKKLYYTHKLILPDFIWDKKSVKKEVSVFKLKTSTMLHGNLFFKNLTVKKRLEIEIHNKNAYPIITSILFEKRNGETFFRNWILKTINNVKVLKIVRSIEIPNQSVPAIDLKMVIKRSQKRFITNLSIFTNVRFTNVTLLNFMNLKMLPKIFCNYKFKGYKHIKIEFDNRLNENNQGFLNGLCTFLKNIRCVRVDLSLNLREEVIKSVLMKSLKHLKIKQLFITIVGSYVKNKKNILKQFNENVQINLQ